MAAAAAAGLGLKALTLFFKRIFFSLKVKKQNQKNPTVLRLLELIGSVKSKSFYIEQITEVNGGENQKTSIF